MKLCVWMCKCATSLLYAWIVVANVKNGESVGEYGSWGDVVELEFQGEFKRVC